MMMHARRQSENSVHESETAIDDDDESWSDSPHLSAPRMKKKKMSHSSLFLRVTILKLRARVGTGMMKEQPSQIIGTATSRDQD